jgi:hypothetical protein
MAKKKQSNRNHSEKDSDSVQELEMRRKLNAAGLRVHHVDPDGNCLFRAFASQLLGDEEKHHELRDACCGYIENEEPDFFSGFLDDESLTNYVHEMRNPGTWGTQLEIVALCKRYHVDCVIFRPDGLHYRIECDKPDNEDVRILMISHHDEEHFNEVRFKETSRVLASFDELELLLSPEPDNVPKLSKKNSREHSRWKHRPAPKVSLSQDRVLEL